MARNVMLTAGAYALRQTKIKATYQALRRSGKRRRWYKHTGLTSLLAISHRNRKHAQHITSATYLHAAR